MRNANLSNINFAGLYMLRVDLQNADLDNSIITADQVVQTINPPLNELNQSIFNQSMNLTIQQAQKDIINLPNDNQLSKLDELLDGFGTMLMEKAVKVLTMQNEALGAVGDGNFIAEQY